MKFTFQMNTLNRRSIEYLCSISVCLGVLMENNFSQRDRLIAKGKSDMVVPSLMGGQTEYRMAFLFGEVGGGWGLLMYTAISNVTCLFK